jgi:hypothetical protein
MDNPMFNLQSNSPQNQKEDEQRSDSKEKFQVKTVFSLFKIHSILTTKKKHCTTLTYLDFLYIIAKIVHDVELC